MAALGLWLYFYEAEPPDRLAQQAAILTDAERRSGERFRFERDRRQYLASRVLLRRALSQYAPVAPAEWRFEAVERGAPRIAGPDVGHGLSFSLTHTSALVALAVSATYARVGVDAEEVRDDLDVLALAGQHFSAEEARTIARAPASARVERFLEYWTLKESFLKATGAGIGGGVDACSFDLGASPIRLHVPPGSPEDPARWSFDVLRASPRHLVAVAVEAARAAWSLRVTRLPPWPAPAASTGPE